MSSVGVSHSGALAYQRRGMRKGHQCWVAHTKTANCSEQNPSNHNTFVFIVTKTILKTAEIWRIGKRKTCLWCLWLKEQLICLKVVFSRYTVPLKNSWSICELLLPTYVANCCNYFSNGNPGTVIYGIVQNYTFIAIVCWDSYRPNRADMFF